MKMIDIKDLTAQAISQTLGSNFQTVTGVGNIDELKAIDSYKLADVGKAVTSETLINSLTNNMISLCARHYIDSREFVDRIKTINVDSFDWGGFIQRTRIGLGEIMNDPMMTKVTGTSYSDIEHTYYGADVHSKIYEEAKAIMTPISIESEKVRDAFLSWDKMNEFWSAVRTQIDNTVKLALYVYKKMLFGCAIAVSDKKTNTAIHLITEAVTRGIIKQIDVSENQDGSQLRNPSYAEVRNNPDWLKYVCQRIAETRDYMTEISSAFNDGSIPTWTNDAPRLELLADLEKAIKFNVKADTFHPDELGFGEYETISGWQGIKDSTSKDFDVDVLSSVIIANDSNDKLGIGTNGYNKTGVLGLMFDPMAIGMCLYRTKVTSSYTACADFWTTFNHTLVNYLIDSSYSIVALIAD